MFLPEVKKQLGQMAVGIAALGAVMVLVFALFGEFNSRTILGALLGCGWAYINFVLLAFAVQKAVDKSENGAKAYMSGTYTLRLILTAGVVIAAIKLPYFNYVAAIIPILFPRIIIFALNLFQKKNTKDVTS